jgi:hypothetical protein
MGNPTTSRDHRHTNRPRTNHGHTHDHRTNLTRNHHATHSRDSHNSLSGCCLWIYCNETARNEMSDDSNIRPLFAR